MDKKKLDAEYNATFDGSEQLEHTLHEISDTVKCEQQKIPVEQLVLTEFKKQSRAKTRIGLAASVEHWGVVSPIHVLAMEDNDKYLVLDGVRRVVAAMRNNITEIQCVVWKFDDPDKGKKFANILALMINRVANYDVTEQWEMLQVLEDVNEVQPALAEYLLGLQAGEAMKLKDIMLSEMAYDEIKEKLIDGSYNIEQAYKKLCTLRKKENALEKEDNTAIANPDEDGTQTAGSKRLSDKEVDEKLEIGGSNADFEIGEPAMDDVGTDDDSEEQGELAESDVTELLQESDAISVDTDTSKEDKEVTKEEIDAIDKTDELRGSSLYQKVGQRHPIDPNTRTGTFIRDGFKCRCCGIGGNEAYLSILAFHHAIPVAMGGPDTKENGLTLCVNCHIMLHNYLMGKLQVDYDVLSQSERQRFMRIIKFGNIALAAKKKQHISLKDLHNAVEADTKHPMPNKFLAENTKSFEEAKAMGANITNLVSEDDDDLLSVVEEVE